MVSVLNNLKQNTNQIQIVPRASVIIPGAADVETITIIADHNNMVKFDSREYDGYQKVVGHLQLLAEEASDAVSASWAKEEKIEKGTIAK